MVAVPVMGAADLLNSGMGTRSAPADAGAFARICADILADPNLLEQLSTEARNLAHQWSENIMVTKLADFYLDVIAQKNTVRATGFVDKHKSH